MNPRVVLAIAAVVAAPLATAAPKIVAFNIDNVVHPITVQIAEHAVEQAQREHASAVLIRLNTPGGMVDASREVIEKLIASPVPIITYVTPSGGRAASAGFFILEAGDVAAMADGTNTGASSPVTLGQPMDPVLRRKVENDLSAFLRALVAKRGRNVELAQKTVSEAKSFTDSEALESKLIDLIAKDQNDLFAKIHGRQIVRFNGTRQKLDTAGATVIEYNLTIREQIISAIADPNVAFLLLILGLLGVYVEFSHPGLILPGVAGGIAFVMALSALSVLPLDWTGVVLLILAGTLFVLEAKFTSHGILGIGGAVAMVLGALILVSGPAEMRIHLSTALAVSIPFALITTFLATIAFRARENKVLTGREALLDSIAVARTALAPAGTVFVHGEYWEAVSTQPVESGTPVRVVAIDGLRLKVEPVKP